MGRKVLEHVDELARLEALDVGKPLKQGRADAVALARYLEFYGGAADKVHGRDDPLPERLHRADAARAARRDRPHRALELPDADHRPQRRRGAGDGQCLRAEAGRGGLPHRAGLRAHRRGGRLAGRRAQRRARAGRGGRRGAHRASRRQPPVLHRLGRDRARWCRPRRRATPCRSRWSWAASSPQIVFADADLDAALPFLVNAGIQNAGQTCSAASRILVERAIFDEVVARMAERYRALRVGPALADLDVGPLISARQHEIVSHYLALARDSGLQVAAQGEIVARRAGRRLLRHARRWWPACPIDHALAQEEIFGPVQVVIAFDGEAEAIAHRQRHGLRPGGRRVDARRRPAAAHGARAEVRPGVRQQLRRRRRRRAALRRRRAPPATAARRASRRCTASRR